MRNLDPVLIERANQVSFSGGGGNLVNREYLNAVSRFSPRFPETDDLEENQRLSSAPDSKDGKNSFIRLILTGSGRRAEFVSWMVAGKVKLNFKKRKNSLTLSGAEESFAAKMTALSRSYRQSTGAACFPRAADRSLRQWL